MALTATQKAEIIYQLGYPAKTLDVGSTDYSKIVADRLESFSAAMEPIVIRVLGRLKKIDVLMEEALCRLSAKKVGDIETNEFEIDRLRSEKKRILKELSDLVDLAIVKQSSGGVKVCI